MKRKLFIFMALAALVFCSCNSSDKEQMVTESQEIVGLDNYLTNLRNAKSHKTRSTLNDSLCILGFMEASKDFLLKNDITASDLELEENDTRIIIIAMAVADYYKIYGTPTKRASVGGCILSGLGIRSLFNGGIKKYGARYIIKSVGKAVAKKAIPYVGWGLFAVEVADCLFDGYKVTE